MSDQVGPFSYLGKRTAGDSDQARQVGRDDGRVSGQSVQPQQSGWMAHWTQSSVKSITQSLNHSEFPSMSKETECQTEQCHVKSQLERVTGVSNPRKRDRDVTRAGEVKSKSGNLKINSENVRTFALPKSGTPSQGDGSLPEIASNYSDIHLRSHDCLEKNSSAVSRKNENRFSGSTSGTLPYGVRQETSATESYACIKEGTCRLSLHLKLKEHLDNINHHSSFSALRHGNTDRSEFLDGPSTSKTQLLIPAAKKWEQLSESSAPLQVSPSEPVISEKFYLRYAALSKLPYSLCDVESTKIYTTIGSIEKVSGGPSKIPQATRNFLALKASDFDMPDEQGQIFRDSLLSAKTKEGCLEETPSIYADYNDHDRTGVKLQPLRKTIDMENGEEAGAFKSSEVELKNESSSGTDTMDMDNFHNHYICGVAFPQSNKEATKGEKILSVQPEMTLSGKRTDSKLWRAGLLDLNEEPMTALPDINLELPASFDVASPADRIETSTSRTKRLDAEHLITHVEHPIRSKSTACPDSILSQELSSRWVKRLKLNSSDSHAHNTKSSKMAEALPFEHDISTIQGKEQRCLDQTVVLLKERKPCSIDPLKKEQGVSLSHPWFRRWCSRQDASYQKKSGLAVISVPHSSTKALNHVQNKRFPSIAAMALTGKAMSEFQPCDIQKRGCCFIWNIDGF